jgi:hypothetical protein
MVRCPKCGSENVSEQDSDIDLLDCYADFICICEECNCYFKCVTSLRVEEIEEIL